MPPFAATIAAWTDSQTPAAAGRSRDEMMTMTRTQQQQQHMSSSVPHLPAPPPPPPSYDDSMTAAAVGGQQQQQQQAYDNRRSGSSPAGPTTSMWGSSVVGEDVKKHRCGHVLLDEDVHVQDDDGGGDDEKQAMMRHDTSGQAAVAAVAAPRSLARRQAPVPVHSRCSHGQGQGPRFEPIWLPLPSESRGVSSFLELKDTVNSLQQQQQLQRLEALLRSRDMPADTWTALIADLESAASHSSSSSPSSPPPPPAPTVSAGFDRLSTGFSRATHIALDPIPLVGPLTGSLARMSYCAVSGVTRAAMHVSGVGAVVDAGLRAGAKRKDKQRRGKKKERGRQAEGDSYAGQEEMNAKNRDVGGGVVAAAPNAEEEEAVVVARWNEQVFLRRGIRIRLVNRSAPTTARHPDLRRSSSSSSPSSSSSDSDSDFRPSSSLSPTTHARLLEVRDGRRAARRAGKQLRKEAKREKEARKEREQVERRQLKEENKAMTREKRSGGVSVGQTVLATADAHSAQVTRWIVVEPA